MKNITNKSAGFTLVEVMIAGVILIMSLTTMTLVYRGAALSSEKAADNIEFSASVGLIFNTIQGRIRGANAVEPLSGEGVLDGVNYHWISTLIEKKGAADRLNAESGEWQAQPERVYLWNIQLTVERGSKQRAYSYKELSWSQ
jgi:type II secretory pathway pseudopilin PulG